MCQGADPDPIRSSIAAPKLMGHGKVIPPNTVNKQVLLTYLQHMSEKLAARLRRHDMQSQHFFIGLKNYQCGWIGDKLLLPVPTEDGRKIYSLCQKILREYWQGEGIYQVQVTALDPHPANHQLNLFAEANCSTLNKTIDTINKQYGEFTIAPARLLKRSKSPNVIAPAWQPKGHRQTV